MAFSSGAILFSRVSVTYSKSLTPLAFALSSGDTFGLVAPLFEQARVCANHLSGHGVAEYKTLPSATKLKVTGINLFSLGNFLGDEESEEIRFSDPSAKVYKKLVIKDRHIIGVVLYGDTKDGSWYQSLLEQRCNIEDMREFLIFGQGYFQTAKQTTTLDLAG